MKLSNPFVAKPKIIILENCKLTEKIYSWLENARFNKSKLSCVWDILGHEFKLADFNANIFAQYDFANNLPLAKTIMRADPVNLQADFSGLVVAENMPQGLSYQQACELTNAVNRDISDMKLHCPQTNRWYISLDKPLDFTSLPTSCVKNSLVVDAQDLPLWLQQQLTQAQICLHNHPINQKRQLAALPIINSLWLWGACATEQKVNLVKSKKLLLTDNEEISIFANSLKIKNNTSSYWQQNYNSDCVLVLDANSSCSIIEPQLNNNNIQVYYQGYLYK